jgi:hypothetical protein
MELLFFFLKKKNYYYFLNPSFFFSFCKIITLELLKRLLELKLNRGLFLLFIQKRGERYFLLNLSFENSCFDKRFIGLKLISSLSGS